MLRNKRFGAGIGATAALTASIVAMSASPAMALTTTDTVTGTAQPELSIAVSTPASAFTTGFQPGGTANSAGALLVTDTGSTPTLTAADVTSASNKGHMQLLNPITCSSSAAFLANPLSVTVTGTGVTSTPISLSGTGQTVAAASAPVAAAVWDTAYQQTIGSGETLATGCVYTVTTTYTLS